MKNAAFVILVSAAAGACAASNPTFNPQRLSQHVKVLAESETHPGELDLPGAVTATLGLTSLVSGISRAGDHELFGNQWLLVYPGLLLSLTVLAVNLLSSWLRVALDPQEREKKFASRATKSSSVGGAAL